MKLPWGKETEWNSGPTEANGCCDKWDQDWSP